MRPPSDDIAAPAFPKGSTWLNTAPLRMDKQLRRPVLIEFWDAFRPSSLRTLPYVRAWHERYAGDGLRVISVHSPAYEAGRDEATVTAAVQRLGIGHPVLLDPDRRLWNDYGNQGWPVRYLWNQRLRLDDYHYGEGAYRDTESAIQRLLGIEREPLGALRPEDDPDALLVVPTADRPGPYSGPYEAGGVWGVFTGTGEIRVNGESVTVDWPGARPLIEHPRSTEGKLELEVGAGVVCLETHFTPGLADPASGPGR